jgi:hypothetical protein
MRVLCSRSTVSRNILDLDCGNNRRECGEAHAARVTRPRRVKLTHASTDCERTVKDCKENKTDN